MHLRRPPVDRLTLWLLGSRLAVPKSIASQLMNGLFASIPIFLGGILNITAVAAVAVSRHPSLAFFLWLSFEMALGVVRLAVLVYGRQVIQVGRTPPRLLAALLSCAWAGSVGFGTYLCLTSGDWVLATIACLSAAAMVCGICLRNFGTPRLAAIMVFLTLLPCAVAGLLTGEPIMPIISVQLPIFFLTIFSAAFSLHRMLVSKMTALNDLERSESLNRTILQASPDHTLILDAEDVVTFYNQPMADNSDRDTLVGREWLSLLPDADQAVGVQALEDAKAGRSANLITHHLDASGQKRWADVIVKQICDGSGRLIVVARDITHQKKSEEQAIWMAQHDALTGLPNRALLQDRLDGMLNDADHAMSGALLILDVDNFKSINDTFGHDAGDALLCAFAGHLRAAVGEEDIVARTGGDEFALILATGSEAEVERTAERIFERLREPFSHGGRLLDCGASIGASFIPRDGKLRSEIMKAADIALYAAKAGGRTQLRIFESAMMVEVERHQAMIASARYALQHETIVPHYQPKMSLRTSEAIGFEALLRWRDRDGALQGPNLIMAAFDDPVLSGPLSDRMLERILGDVEHWVRTGIAFGHVAINVTAADFRRGGVVETILARLDARDIPTGCIQIEVTETVFLSQGADDVKDALRRLSEHGIRIALDDFGTGYASPSHLNQFPVNLLKIDRSFVEKIGSNADAEAISATVINLGHCLGLEVVAEGVETRDQEMHLIGMNCDTAQGFLYAKAMPMEEVELFLASARMSVSRACSA
ncbi:PAS domain S-box-containing protein/diguanylate cyclase (GGDEF) domain-containing protein [Sphingobium faniae]|nr:PAS domain S-box-containing protein/diguanylate cyclase (GGDEF) domain-containing protein [Sphingobium faniae]